MQEKCSPNLDQSVDSTRLMPFRKNDGCRFYSRKRKAAVPPSQPTLPSEMDQYSATLTDLSQAENNDFTVHHIISLSTCNKKNFGKISYEDDDSKMEITMYDPEDDRDLNSFNYEAPHLVISNVRSLKRKAGAAKQLVTKKKSSSPLQLVTQSLHMECTSTMTVPEETIVKTETTIMSPKEEPITSTLPLAVATQMPTTMLSKNAVTLASNLPLILTRTEAPTILSTTQTMVLSKPTSALITTNSPSLKLTTRAIRPSMSLALAPKTCLPSTKTIEPVSMGLTLPLKTYKSHLQMTNTMKPVSMVPTSTLLTPIASLPSAMSVNPVSMVRRTPTSLTPRAPLPSAMSMVRTPSLLTPIASLPSARSVNPVSMVRRTATSLTPRAPLPSAMSMKPVSMVGTPTLLRTLLTPRASLPSARSMKPVSMVRTPTLLTPIASLPSAMSMVRTPTLLTPIASLPSAMSMVRTPTLLTPRASLPSAMSIKPLPVNPLVTAQTTAAKPPMKVMKMYVPPKSQEKVNLTSGISAKKSSGPLTTVLQENIVANVNLKSPVQNPIAETKQPVVLKRIKILNPSNVPVDMNDIIKHIQETALAPDKTGQIQTKWLPIRTADLTEQLEACTIPMTKMHSLQKEGSKSIVSPRMQAINNVSSKLIIRRVKVANPKSGEPVGTTRTVEPVNMKKRVDSKILKAALVTARKRNTGPKNLLLQSPRLPPSPEFAPGQEDYSCLYLKVEDPYPDKTGRLIEPSLSLIERSLNKTSMKAEDVTTWSSKNIEALGSEGVKLQTPPIPTEEKVVEKVNDTVAERSSSPAWFDPLNDRPDTPESDNQPMEVDSAKEQRETLELDQVYTEACNHQLQKRPAPYVPMPDPEDPESVVVFLKRKLEHANEENKELIKDLQAAKKLITKLKDKVLEFKLARGFSSTKKRVKSKVVTKTAPSNSTDANFVEPNDDFWN